MNDFYALLLGALCVWRLTHLLHAEDGPWDLLVQLRRRAGEGFWGDLLGCFYCLSLWLAVPLALLLGETVWEKILLWPGLSAAACLFERATRRETDDPPATWWEEDPPDEQESEDVLRPIERPLPQAPPATGSAPER